MFDRVSALFDLILSLHSVVGLTDPINTRAMRDRIWGRAHELIANFVVVNGGSRFPIDIGSGVGGHLARTLLQTGGSLGKKVIVTSIDWDPDHVEANSIGSGSNLFFVHGDATKPLPYQDSFFDGLSSSFCFEYLTVPELYRAFAEFKRVLVPSSPVAFTLYTDSSAGRTSTVNGCEWRTHRPSDVQRMMLDAGFTDIVFTEQSMEVPEMSQLTGEEGSSPWFILVSARA